MAENKTKPTAAAVSAFIKKVKDPQRQKDCLELIQLMESATKEKPVMWGNAIVGFGVRHYVYDSGREGDTVIVGFSPRAQALALYLAGGLEPLRDELARLGSHSTGKGCLYIKSLKDVDLKVLRAIVAKSFKSVKQN